MDFRQQYAAIDARDTRFDGQFITAVSSTGIYCRPSCPARTPKPANVTFYRTSAAAHDAGYRACKRCLPDAVPGDPAWNLRGDTAARAMRLIIDGEVDRTGVGGLSMRLGYSTRQLGRILRQELGAGPLALARAQRAQTARTLLTASSLRFADVAFASGFGSIRQFNETLQQVFGLTPGQLREASGRGHSGSGRIDRAADVDPTGGPLRISLLLPTRLPYDNGIFGVLAAGSVEGIELGTASTYERTLRLPGGPAWFRTESARTGSNGRAALPVTVSVSGLGDLPPLLSRIRRLFDLDADPVAIDTALSRVPVLRGLVAARPGLRLPGAVDADETLLRAVVGQYIGHPGGAAAYARLAASGPEVQLPGSTLTRIFPSAQDIAAAPDALLPASRRCRQTLRAVAQQLASGALAIDVGADADELRAQLLDVDGVSPWTAEYVIMRVLGHPDIELPDDPAVRAGWSTVVGAAGGPACDARNGTRGGPGRADAGDAGSRTGSSGASSVDAESAGSCSSGASSPRAGWGLDRAMAAVRPWRSYAGEHLRRAAALAGPMNALSAGAEVAGNAAYFDPVTDRK
ncbi:helix-turn-helix domain-containing protein [Arthrobacter echini]|uniref:Helix-turn-helix domain-containing protein n=1 Tax=Arthrobacter echini TaxID=1529066 RepID=A0A4S5E0G5_9MICC|nr:Ada metal-binding domain-containing protein [Arthrobacter echini]THJ64773.1 helix-turn-helix domain-containing protein [Arthrobacter echini]